jgi:hypothetical protein
VLQDALGLSISEGRAVAIIERAGETAQPEAEAIGERMRQSEVIGSDETSARHVIYANQRTLCDLADTYH